MNEKALKLIWRMVLATMAGNNKIIWALYDEYILETRLHVPVKEYLEWREERIA